MTKQTPKLHAIVLNVRADTDTYSAMPVRIFKAVADFYGIPAIVASTERSGGHLRHVEGTTVRMIHPTRVEGLCSRLADACNVVLIDVPVDLADLEASTPLIDNLRAEARASMVEYHVFTTEGGKLANVLGAGKSPIILGRGFVNRLYDLCFDPLLLLGRDRIPCVQSRPNNYLDQPGRPIASYLDDAYPEPDFFKCWFEGLMDDARKRPVIRSILKLG
ncbi:hypothetical protein [Roseibium sp.]|uniref:hypothetical protein n=1 Tax=Roseibium sp. TaxID=1936156 RepID=UPI003296B231